MSETATEVDTRCNFIYPNGKRCKHEGNPCWLEGWNPEKGPDDYYCSKHAFEVGYCPGCGLFWGGVESFEFSDHHLCDNCEDELRAEMEEDEDEEMDYVYSQYPFDGEHDWEREEAK